MSVRRMPHASTISSSFIWFRNIWRGVPIMNVLWDLLLIFNVIVFGSQCCTLFRVCVDTMEAVICDYEGFKFVVDVMLLAFTSESAVEGLDLVRHSAPQQTVCCLFCEHRGELLVVKLKLRNQYVGGWLSLSVRTKAILVGRGPFCVEA